MGIAFSKMVSLWYAHPVVDWMRSNSCNVLDITEIVVVQQIIHFIPLTIATVMPIEHVTLGRNMRTYSLSSLAAKCGANCKPHSIFLLLVFNQPSFFKFSAVDIVCHRFIKLLRTFNMIIYCEIMVSCAACGCFQTISTKLEVRFNKQVIFYKYNVLLARK